MAARPPSSLVAPAALLALVLALTTRDARAADPPERDHDFYQGYDYGSQSLQNPFYGMINRGFDVIQLRVQRPPTVSLIDVRNVTDNLASPFKAIAHDQPHGWGTWLTQEIFPLSYTHTTARWVPNYSLHLLGGGETFAWMREWFLAHEAPEIAATAFAAAALMTAALINESLENKGVVGFNTDALADIYVFDIGGIVLYSFKAMRKLLSHTVTINDWSLQPAIVYPTGELHNVGNYYALKVPVPKVDWLKLFVYGGVSTLGGLSFKVNRELTISGAFGGRISEFANVGGHTVLSNEVHYKAAGAVFLDRNESLLASIQVSNINDYFFLANLYPNAIVHTTPGVGGWTAIGKDGRWLAGISFTHALGLGIGLGTR